MAGAPPAAPVNGMVEEVDAPLWNAIASAARRGDVEEVLRLGGERPHLVRKTDENGVTMLLMAAFDGQLGTVKSLLALGADVNALWKHGITALVVAAFEGHIEVVKVLIAAKAALHLRVGDLGPTPLHVAVVRGHTDVVLELVKNGADMEALWGGCTAAQTSFVHGHSAALLLFLRAGVDAWEEIGEGIGDMPVKEADAGVRAVLDEFEKDYLIWKAHRLLERARVKRAQADMRNKETEGVMTRSRKRACVVPRPVDVVTPATHAVCVHSAADDARMMEEEEGGGGLDGKGRIDPSPEHGSSGQDVELLCAVVRHVVLGGLHRGLWVDTRADVLQWI